ncbi:MAG: methyltransferase domain-containing protein [Oligoflexia bacterium]|nr:methyltransferase domain-containing protein [Oligoflexia bacterium]
MELFNTEFVQDNNHIFQAKNLVINPEQETEIKLREEVAERSYDDYLKELSHHHSIPVMDVEVENFLKLIPQNGTIIDVGGCWGWHWRKIGEQRPDVKVIIVDFVKTNLIHAVNVLGDLINKQIFLLHGDATSLPFEDHSFDGYWSVQTLQHIPNFEDSIDEAYRVLKPNGQFVNYSLNNQSLIKLIMKTLGKKYHEVGYVDNVFYLERFSKKQIDYIEKVFKGAGQKRYSEILFKPSLKFTVPGSHGFLGMIDSKLSGSLLGSSVARQKSFHIQKKS